MMSSWCIWLWGGSRLRFRPMGSQPRSDQVSAKRASGAAGAEEDVGAAEYGLDELGPDHVVLAWGLLSGGGQDRVIGVGVEEHAAAQFGDVGQAVDLQGRLPGPADRGQGHAEQQGDDGHDDQQLDEGEGGTVCGSARQFHESPLDAGARVTGSRRPRR